MINKHWLYIDGDGDGWGICGQACLLPMGAYNYHGNHDNYLRW